MFEDQVGFSNPDLLDRLIQILGVHCWADLIAP